MEFDNAAPTVTRMDRKRIIILAAIIILACGVVVLGGGYLSQRQKIHMLEDQVQKERVNDKIVNFLDLFIQKVLESQKEISFDDRLKLENEVRALNDNQIIAQWDQFVNSKSVEDAQLQVKNLLHLLVQKIYY